MRLTVARPIRRVVKLGGSLFTLPDLSERLTAWLDQQPDRQTALICGGGPLIDVMRQWDDRFGLESARMHWRCVELLRHSFDVLTELLPQYAAVRDETEFERWIENEPTASTTLLQVDAFYRSEGPGIELAENWDTTTDAIAVHLADRMDAEELVLLKSCDSASTIDWREAAKLEIVDAQFPSVVGADLELTLVNLRQWKW